MSAPVQEWQRLDPRMLLVHPIREVVRFLPVLLGLSLAGTATRGEPVGWQLLGVLVPVVLGLLKYLTTRFRIADGRIELRHGLISRHVQSTPIDRVRSVDLTATLIHRVLGLTTAKIGAGTTSDSDERLDLDGLPVARARALREQLLRSAAAAEAQQQAPFDPNAPAVDPSATAPPIPPAAPDRVVARFSPRWLLFAPFTVAGFALAAGLVGVASQVVDSLDWWHRIDHLPMLDGSRSWWVLAPLAFVALLAVVSAFAVVGYAVTNYGFTLTHSARDRSWHIRRGLLTTRETSFDDARMLGVALHAPLGLRWAGGRRLTAVVAGLGGEASQSATLLPPAPRDVVEAAAEEVVGAPEAMRMPLRSHGPAAHRRRYTRALAPALVGSIAAVVAVALDAAHPALLVPAALLPLAAVGLAADRWRSLGHAVTPEWVVMRSGSLGRRRVVLDADAVIGWNLRSTWFQRRVGLTTLSATTSGGSQAYAILDVPEADAVAVARTATPRLLEPFLADSASGDRPRHRLAG